MSIDNSIQNGLKISIPEQLKTGEFRFIRLRFGGKEAIDKDWQGENNYGYWEIGEHLESGANYGVICDEGDVCILDADNYTRINELMDNARIFENTFTVSSGSPGRFHIYFKCAGLGDKKITISDPVTGDPLGDIRPCGCHAYVVGPSCIHPSGARYEIADPSPIKRIDVKELDDKFFSRVKSKRLTNSAIDALLDRIPKKNLRVKQSLITEQLNLRIEDIAMPVGDVIRHGDEYQGSHPIHGSTNGKNFSINTAKNAWFCYRCESGGDPITFLAVKHGLISCEDAGKVEIKGETFSKIKELLSNEYGYKEQISKIDDDYKGIKEVTTEDISRIAPQGYVLEPRLPEDHFLNAYADTICELTDSYRDYQYATALMLLSMVVKRRARFNPTYGAVYPNIWMFLLGTSSYSKKTTAIKFARNLAMEVTPDNSLSNNITPERLIQDVADLRCAWQFIDEASGLLSDMKKKAFMSSYKELLCSLYDETPYTMARSKRGRGRPKKGESEQEQQNEWQIRDGYINCLFATTPDSFGQNVDKNDLKSGMLYRFAIVYPRYTKTLMPTTERTPAQDAALDGLVGRLRQIARYFDDNDLGMLTFSFSKEAAEYHQAWEEKNSQNNHENSGDDKQSIQARQNVIMQKLAMLLEIGGARFHQYIFMKDYVQEADDTFEISLETTKECCRLIDEYFIPVFQYVYDRVCMSATQTTQDKILKVLEDHGGKIPLRSLRQRVRVNRKQEFEDAIEYMCDDSDNGTAEIQIVNVLNPETKKYTKMVVLTSGE